MGRSATVGGRVGARRVQGGEKYWDGRIKKSNDLRRTGQGESTSRENGLGATREGPSNIRRDHTLRAIGEEPRGKIVLFASREAGSSKKMGRQAE